VVMGFGFGALLMSKVIAPGLDAAFHGELPLIFAGIGLIVGGVGLIAAVNLHNPPSPAAFAHPEPIKSQQIPSELWSRQFLLLWLVFFCNIAGVSLLSGFSRLCCRIYGGGPTPLCRRKPWPRLGRA